MRPDNENRWSTDYDGRCGNCHEKFESASDKYCTYCGTKRGEGKFEPYENVIYCVYGPMPKKRTRECTKCGHKWTYTAMLDKQKFCRQCGGDSKLVDNPENEEKVPVMKPQEQDGYVDLKPDVTTDLFTDTLELFRERDGQTITAQGTVLRTGRQDGSDIKLEQANTSRLHATFFFEDGSWYIRDEKSTNGTYLNGTFVKPGKKYKLYVGDIISFGPEKYCFFKSRMIPPTPKPAGNFDEAALAILEASIKTFVDSGFNDDTAFKLIITSLSDAPLYVPVQIDVAAMLGNLDPTKLKPGDVITPQKDVRVKVLTLSLEDGGEIVPLFTPTEEVNKGQSVSTMRYYPSDYLPLLLKMEKHVVINPFGDHKFILTFDMIKNILKPVIDNKAQNPLPVPPVPVPKPVEPPVKVEKKGVPIPRKRKQDLENFIGKRIDGKYCILKEIGRGGASVVYLGIDEHANRQLAIKVIDQTAPHVRNIKKFLLQEPHMMMQFDHPAIPKVYDVVEDEQYLYIIREYIEGETLSNVLEKQVSIPADTAVCWTIQLCEALQQLHTHNPPYIFRDMKPRNVMLQPNGNIKIVDFSLAMVYDPTKQDDTIMGTRGYAAPEQYTGNSNFRTDIFALGMTLHQMLTGVDPCQPPYEVKPIRMINPDLPWELEEIIKRCIQINPDDRFQSCEELIAALQGGPIYPPKKKGLFEKLFGNKHSKPQINRTAAKIYEGMNKEYREKVYYGQSFSAERILTSLTRDVFGQISDDNINLCHQIYLQTWIRAHGGLDPKFSTPSYIKEALRHRFSFVDENVLSKCITHSLYEIYEHEPELRKKAEFFESLQKMMRENAGKNKSIEDMYLKDCEYGLVANKPVFVNGFGSDKEYLSHLATIDGTKLTYERVGSSEVEGIAGSVDMYRLLLPNGEEHLRIFLCNYGSRTTKDTPQGLKFVE